MGHRFLSRPSPVTTVASKTIYRDDYRKLVERLRDRREMLGLSQSEVARALGWPQQRVSAVEAGARRLDVIEFFQLTSTLGLTESQAVKL
ncbi:helix-turn-helix domain-containing protein, partial [Xanthomonas euvesicatoria]